MNRRIKPFLLCAAFALTLAALSQAKANAEFTLPASVQIIEDGAFQNTAAEEVILQDSVEYIGDYAFADMSELSAVTIPGSTVYIGENAFSGSDPELIIVCEPDSYAMRWAQEHDIRYSFRERTPALTGGGPVFRLISFLMEFAVITLFLFKADDEIYCFRNRSELQTLDYDFP